MSWNVVASIRGASERLVPILNRQAVALALIFAVVGVGIYLIPLVDPSEARYATISQRMVLSNQWLIPEINLGQGFVPFWGKPPLHFWSAAVSMRLFGFSEFAARLPSLLNFCVIMFLTLQVAKRCSSKEAAAAVPFIMLSSPLFLFVCLSCMTDSTLTLYTTVALTGFALAIQSEQRSNWGYLFFIGLGAGFLTKGPLIFALVGFVTAGWTLWHRKWNRLRALPWVGGISLMFLIALPWFVLAELRSPGLLHYFFVNENYQRFTAKEYVDFYGSSHHTFRGIILVYAFLAAMPWGLLLLRGVSLPSPRKSTALDREWASFFILWALAPAAVFLPSNNVLATYVVPGVPGMVLLTARAYALGRKDFLQYRKRYLVPFVGVGLAAVAVLSVFATRLEDELSTRELVQTLSTEDQGSNLSFLHKVPYSAIYYLQANELSRPFLPVSRRPGSGALADTVVKRSEVGKLPDQERRLLEPSSGTHEWAILDTDEDDTNDFIVEAQRE